MQSPSTYHDHQQQEVLICEDSVFASNYYASQQVSLSSYHASISTSRKRALDIRRPDTKANPSIRHLHETTQRPTKISVESTMKIGICPAIPTLGTIRMRSDKGEGKELQRGYCDDVEVPAEGKLADEAEGYLCGEKCSMKLRRKNFCAYSGKRLRC